MDCCGVDWFAHGFSWVFFSWLVGVVVVVRVWYGFVVEEEEEVEEVRNNKKESS